MTLEENEVINTNTEPIITEAFSSDTNHNTSNTITNSTLIPNDEKELVSSTKEDNTEILQPAPSGKEEEPTNEVKVTSINNTDISSTDTEIYTAFNPQEYLKLSESNNLLMVPLAKLGTWHHRNYGKVAFKPSDFEDVINNIKHNRLGYKPYITFGHIDEDPNSTDSHRKRGDLVDITTNNDVLYGLFKAKPEAIQAVKRGEYEFSSGEFTRNYMDKTTGDVVGTVLSRVALTNSPFIPFSDKEKVQALSDNTEAPYKVPFILGFDVTNTQIDEENFMTQQEMNTNSDQQNVNRDETPAVDEQNLPINGSITNVSTDNTKQVIDEAPKTSVDNSLGGDMPQEVRTSIVNEITKQVKGIYDEQLAKATDIINNLENKVKELNEELNSQRQVTQAFSDSLSASREQELNQRLAEKGIPPALLQRYQSIRSSLSQGNETIKLSDDAGNEKELSLIEAMNQLLSDAVNTQAVPYQQQGMVTTPPNDPYGVVDTLKEMIDANKKMIAK